MKIETVSGAAIAALIAFGTAFLALMQQEDINGIRDIGEATWIVLGVGGLLTFLKDYQAISTRRAIATMRGVAPEDRP